MYLENRKTGSFISGPLALPGAEDPVDLRQHRPERSEDLAAVHKVVKDTT